MAAHACEPRLLRYLGLAQEIAYEPRIMRRIALATLVLDDRYVVRRLRALRGSSTLRLPQHYPVYG